MSRSYASDRAELREALMALERAAAFVPPEPGLVEDLVETLIWVRKNYGGGDIREINARIDAAIEHLARFAPEGRHWRHVTSGMFVSEIGRGRMQTAEPIGDMTPIVIYHHAGEHGGGTFWARPTREFEDGRFVAFASAP